MDLDTDATESKGGMGAGVAATIGGLGALLLAILQNREEITVDFLFWSFTWPLWLYTVVVALIGALVWFGLGVMRRRRRRKARRGR
jgi:uncharacterized integral membrane protein